MYSQKARKSLLLVIPAKAGIQYFNTLREHWTPAFAGLTTFCEIINLNGCHNSQTRNNPHDQ
jgi:hypothetical protein